MSFELSCVAVFGDSYLQNAKKGHVKGSATSRTVFLEKESFLQKRSVWCSPLYLLLEFLVTAGFLFLLLEL